MPQPQRDQRQQGDRQQHARERGRPEQAERRSVELGCVGGYGGRAQCERGQIQAGLAGAPHLRGGRVLFLTNSAMRATPFSIALSDAA